MAALALSRMLLAWNQGALMEVSDLPTRRVGPVVRAFAWSVPLSHTLYEWDMGQGTNDLRATWDKNWDSVGHVGHA